MMQMIVLVDAFRSVDQPQRKANMSGNRGGRRPGAGRKPGSATRKTREIAERAAAEGITPLEVMLADMRSKYAAGDLDAAADRACDCAPYMHPRLSSISAVIGK